MKHDLPIGTPHAAARAEPDPVRKPGLLAWMRRRIERWVKRLDGRFGF